MKSHLALEFYHFERKKYTPQTEKSLSKTENPALLYSKMNEDALETKKAKNQKENIEKEPDIMYY